VLLLVLFQLVHRQRLIADVAHLDPTHAVDHVQIQVRLDRPLTATTNEAKFASKNPILRTFCIIKFRHRRHR
jgi:hypothetical protein